jgi:nucleoside-diphosphate-sugar epimerase
MILAVRTIHDGSAVNIGTGKLTTFKETARLFARLAGYDPEIRPLINQPVGVQSRYCDPAYMTAQLAWTPTISLEEGFGRVLNAAYARIQTPCPAVA